jgi:Bacterial alpha-L-rhamnosidase C-terminal domain
MILAGGPLVLLSQYYVGITPDAEKTNAWVIKPMPDGLQIIETTIPVKQGILQLYFRQGANALSMQVQIPPGITSKIAVPKNGFTFNQLKSNGITVTEIKGFHFIKEDDQYFWFDTVSGEYNFEANW